MEVPNTIREAKMLRGNAKRKLTNLMKDGNSLLLAGEGIPHEEYKLLADLIRENLDVLQWTNDQVIGLKCAELKPDDFSNEHDMDKAEQEIANAEENHFSDVSNSAIPLVHKLIRETKRLILIEDEKHTQQEVRPTSTPQPVHARMPKLKFPTFSGDIRDYRRFKEQFRHYSQSLNDIECFYQLTESMERSRERNKIKACSGIKRAWEILDEAYGDEDQVVEALMTDLENINSYEVKGRTNLSGMEKFVEFLQNFETQMDSLGKSADLSGRVLVTQIRRKLPEEHRILFLQKVRDDNIDDSLNSLIKWLHSQLILLKKAKGPFIESRDSRSPNNYQKFQRSNKSVNFSTMSPGYNRNTSSQQPSISRDKSGNRDRDTAKTDNSKPLKCPLHPEFSNHYLKGCHKFKTLSQLEKFEIMNKNGICHRCGHDNCISGKPPYEYEQCQFIQPCQIPACKLDTHFSSICPRVYGLEGYQHYDGQGQTTSNLNEQTTEFTPTKKRVNSMLISKINSNFISCVLPTVMGRLRHGSRSFIVRILLDSGSQISLIRFGIIKRRDGALMQDFNITTVGGDSITCRLRVLECVIESLDGKFSRQVRLTEMENPCGDTPIVTNEQLQQYPHLSGVEIDEATTETIDILLGVENSDLLTALEYVKGPTEDDPIAARCPLGWYIQGGRNTKTESNALINFTQVTAISEIEDFLGIERMGIEPKHCKCSIEAEEKIATDEMQQSVTQLCDGVYQINLPWKKSPNDLPNNYDYAVKRLQNLEKQFKNRPKEWEIYCKQMDDQVTRGVARFVSTMEFDADISNNKKMWFLPHFGVIKDSETTPVRVVYDGKARFQGHSLNDYLAKGHNMNTDLFDIALRFREYEIGVIADISKMFQAVRMNPNDSRFHRYVFRKKPEDPIEVYELTTVTFGDKPSPAAAIIALRHVAAEHAPNDIEIQRIANNQFYVDDLTDSQRSLNDAKQLKSKLISTLEKGNFKIRKWLSNERKLCDPEYYPDDSTTTVLGTKWNLNKDTLSVKEVSLKDFIPTKRNILRMTASYYDVYGILSGILVRPKILLQQLWQYEMGWDDPISPYSDLHKTLETIKHDLQNVSAIEIHRCLIPERLRGKPNLPSSSLHGLSDASEDAMGIGVWLRWPDNEDKADLTFVCAKARLTPLKQSSIPRKELQAVLLLSRLMITIRNALRLEISYMKIWTDSITAISWLRGQSKSFRSYVSYRVGEITSEFNPVKDIAYVPSDQNTIDLVSRGVKANELGTVINGPGFLRKSSNEWPITPNVSIDREDTELKKYHVRNAKILAARLDQDNTLLDPRRFSSWTRLVMVTARILSLKDIPRNKWLKDLTTTIFRWPSRKRINEAKLYWIRYAQKDLDFDNRHIMKLEPIYDDTDQVYRVGGRIHNAPISYDIRHPYLLPKKSYISYLIALERHKYSLHGGHLRTAAEIRKTYWIIGDINLSRQIVRQCVICIRYRGKTVEQRMADLPDFRIKPCTPPFQTTMVDYLGPVNVKLNRNTVTKGYCAVFTCAVTRAVHLECVQDLSTAAFLQALERFISIRGAPGLLISDNATCFRGADNEIRELQLRLNQDEIRSNCQRFDITWKFGPPGGPHHQGAVERMVQEIKKSMRHLVKADKLSFVEWETIFAQISGLLNSRPLTLSSSSPLDDPPITPNHFLIGRGDLKNPVVPCEEYTGNLRKRRELCNTMIDGFWRRWMNNIQKLSPRDKWPNTRENLNKGDIVLVVDENVKRGKWKLAEIINTYSGDDNLVRIVDVKYSDGNVLKRPVTKLVLLMKKEERLDL